MPKKERIQQMTRQEFAEQAKPGACQLNGLPFSIAPKLFSTGSVGWHGAMKVNMQVGEKLMECQLGLTLTVIGSKEWPQEN